MTAMTVEPYAGATSTTELMTTAVTHLPASETEQPERLWPPEPSELPRIDLEWWPAWVTDEALCAQSDPDAWWPERGASTRQARAVCARCPLLAACRDWGLRHELYGVWGGLSELDREEIRAARGIELVPAPGAHEVARWAA